MKRQLLYKTEHGLKKLFYWTAFLFFMTSCEPVLTGDLKVYNQSNTSLTVTSKDFDHKDSVTLIIEPYSIATIKILGGLGNRKQFDCCPCEFEKLYIKTVSGNIKKVAQNKDNWIIPNKSKLKMRRGEGVKCEFYVLQTDI